MLIAAKLSATMVHSSRCHASSWPRHANARGDLGLLTQAQAYMRQAGFRVRSGKPAGPGLTDMTMTTASPQKYYAEVSTGPGRGA